MTPLAWAVFCGVALLADWGVVAQGQELLRPERNDGGSLINQDYYTVDHHPETVGLLRSVEYGHFSQPMFDSFRRGEYKAVIGDLQFTLERIANHPGALSLISTVAMVTKMNGLPVPFFERARALYPQYAFTHAQYGYYLLEIGALDKSVEHLKEATKLDATLPSAHAWLAEAYYKSQKMPLAKQEEGEARKLGYTKAIPQFEGHGQSGDRAPAKGSKKKSAADLQVSKSDGQ
ncbi:MAG: tetratricopeptide repeat protein [Nitrospirae bacterium]|nr:tetratricopeptide repeat protein [Nitrospirota bacterium]